MNAQDLRIVADTIQRVVVVPDQVIKLLLAALLCEGHILLEDAPGTGKTLLAKTISRAIDGSFRRVQATADLLPADITGGSIYHQGRGDFLFVPGPIFANIVLIDEINRATPRAQSSLFEAMAERQVTADGTTYPLPSPFIVLATKNPIDSAGTYVLPDGELDRFLVSLRIGYPNRNDERLILERGHTVDPLAGIDSVITVDALAVHSELVRQVHVSVAVQEYLVELAARTREDARLVTGISPRATVALQHMAQAWAYLSDQTYVSPDDIQDVAIAVLAHRLTVRAGEQSSVKDVLTRLLDDIAV